MLRKLFIGIGTAIEKYKGIRRLIILTLFPIWLWISYRLLIITPGKISYPIVQFYAIFTGIVGTAVGFYFINRNTSDKNAVSPMQTTTKQAFKALDEVEQKAKSTVKDTIDKTIESKVQFDDIDVSPPAD